MYPCFRAFAGMWQSPCSWHWVHVLFGNKYEYLDGETALMIQENHKGSISAVMRDTMAANAATLIGDCSGAIKYLAGTSYNC